MWNVDACGRLKWYAIHTTLQRVLYNLLWHLFYSLFHFWYKRRKLLLAARSQAHFIRRYMTIHSHTHIYFEILFIMATMCACEEAMTSKTDGSLCIYLNINLHSYGLMAFSRCFSCRLYGRINMCMHPNCGCGHWTHNNGADDDGVRIFKLYLFQLYVRMFIRIRTYVPCTVHAVFPMLTVCANFIFPCVALFMQCVSERVYLLNS